MAKQNKSKSEGYRFKNLPLEAASAKELIVELLKVNPPLRKRDIASKIETLHIERGGKKANHRIDALVKSALAMLKKRGIIASENYRWNLCSDEPTEHKTDTEVGVEIAEAIITEQPQVRGWVYLFYLQCCRELAELRGDSYWACKIGRSDTDPVQRVLDQINVSPHPPTVARLIETDSSNKLESTLHLIFHQKDRHLKEAIGKEWFETNLEEFDEILRLLEYSRHKTAEGIDYFRNEDAASQ